MRRTAGRVTSLLERAQAWAIPSPRLAPERGRWHRGPFSLPTALYNPRVAQRGVIFTVAPHRRKPIWFQIGSWDGVPKQGCACPFSLCGHYLCPFQDTACRWAACPLSTICPDLGFLARPGQQESLIPAAREADPGHPLPSAVATRIQPQTLLLSCSWGAFALPHPSFQPAWTLPPELDPVFPWGDSGSGQ